ncbi:MAG: hypothetical protein KGH75_06255 [Rhodospirillales bacterium]|nr:hypothetical protein [Rhodospirillales bacterium]
MVPDIPELLRAQMAKRSVASIARDTGMSYYWLVRFARGEMRNPTWNNLKQLSDFLDKPSPRKRRTNGKGSTNGNSKPRR